MASSHLSLRRWFSFYNRRYFANSLPADTVLQWKPLNGDDGLMQDGAIYIDPVLQAVPRYMRIILLHEMVHLQYPRLTHGKKFRAEIDRLYAAGAFIPLIA